MLLTKKDKFDTYDCLLRDSRFLKNIHLLVLIMIPLFVFLGSAGHAQAYRIAFMFTILFLLFCIRKCWGVIIVSIFQGAMGGQGSSNIGVT